MLLLLLPRLLSQKRVLLLLSLSLPSADPRYFAVGCHFGGERDLSVRDTVAEQFGNRFVSFFSFVSGVITLVEEYSVTVDFTPPPGISAGQFAGCKLCLGICSFRVYRLYSIGEAEDPEVFRHPKPQTILNHREIPETVYTLSLNPKNPCIVTCILSQDWL